MNQNMKDLSDLQLKEKADRLLREWRELIEMGLDEDSETQLINQIRSTSQSVRHTQKMSMVLVPRRSTPPPVVQEGPGPLPELPADSELDAEMSSELAPMEADLEMTPPITALEPPALQELPPINEIAPPSQAVETSQVQLRPRRIREREPTPEQVDQEEVPEVIRQTKRQKDSISAAIQAIESFVTSLKHGLRLDSIDNGVEEFKKLADLAQMSPANAFAALDKHWELARSKQVFYKFYEMKTYLAYWHVRELAKRNYQGAFNWAQWVVANNPMVNPADREKWKTRTLNNTRRGEKIKKIQAKFGDFLFLVQDVHWSRIYDMNKAELELFINRAEAMFAELATPEVLDKIEEAIARIRQSGIQFDTVSYKRLAGIPLEHVLEDQNYHPPPSGEDGAETDVDEENTNNPVYVLRHG